MRLTLNLLSSIAMLFWFSGLIGIIFYLASAKDKTWFSIACASLVILFPAFLGVFYYFKGHSFFFVSPKTFAALTTVVSVTVFFLFLGNTISLKLRGINESGLTTTDGTVYLSGSKVEGADPQTFKEIDDHYSIDSSHVFYRTKILKNLDPVTFSKIGNSSYYRDHSRIVYDGLILEGSDPKSFKVIEDHSYALDKNSVYYMGTLIKAADPETFQVIPDSGFSKDRSNIYYLGQGFDEPVDVSSFQILDSNISKDKNSIFKLPSTRTKEKVIYKVSEADLDSFEILDRGYAKDKNQIYYLGEDPYVVMKDADVASFEVTQYDLKKKTEARDKSRFYLNGKIVK